MTTLAFHRVSKRFALVVPLAASFVLGGCGGKATLDFVGEPTDEVCGNGRVEADEECDDDDTQEGDGCDARCRVEPGYVCTVQDGVSECLETCGNGTLDEGEECEDGNREDGDGCSASCRIEGTCEAPKKLKLTEGNAELTAKLDASNRGGGKSFPKAECGEDEVGGGNDRVYSFTIDEAQDVTIKLSADFNAVLRLLDHEPCDVNEQLDCSNQDGIGAESITRRDLPAGTYYVVVDAATNSGQGDYTLSLTATCPRSNLLLYRIDSYYRDGATLRNFSETCSVRTKGLHLGFTYYSSEYPVALPDRELAPGETLGVISESYARADEVGVASVYTYYGYGTALLCEGKCDFDSGENVLDAVAWGEDGPSLPDGIEFEEGPLVDIGWNTDALNDYIRVDNDGRWPNFTAQDWTVVYEANPDLYPPDVLMTDGFSYASMSGSGSASWAIVTAADESEGNVYRAGWSESFEWQGFVSNTAVTQPRVIAYRFYSDGTAQAKAGLALGVNSAFDVIVGYVYEGAYWLYGEFESSYFTSMPIEDGWHQLELHDIDWAAGTWDVYLDGELYQSVDGYSVEGLGQYPNVGSKLSSVSTVTLANFSGADSQTSEVVLF